MALVLSVLEQGMIYAIMALGVYITYKILDFPDLTVDGSFPLGAAITAVMITKGVHPLITLVVSFAAGAVVGVLTGVIVGNHYDDRIVYRQFKDSRTCKPADLYRKNNI